jgi:transposase
MAILSKVEVDCAMVLNDKGKSIRDCARELGVAESTLRQRVRRARDGAVDKRSQQASSCDPYTDLIGHWMQQQQQTPDRPEGVKHLLWHLREQGYRGSYASVRRYVRKRMAPPKLSPVRRVETRPGAQAQVDWVSGPMVVEELGGAVTLHAFVMSLSHSRMWCVLWSVRQDLLSWIACHNRALEFLGGVPASVRIDNLKTGVSSGAGPWAVLHPGYASYATQMGFAIDPCRAYTASDKGKVERRGRDLAWLAVDGGERFASLSVLQERTRDRVLERSARLVCPVTGRSVHESWQAERSALRALPPTLPQPFDVEVIRPVGRDCLVNFEGRQYSVPFAYVSRQVRVRGCCGRVQVWCEDRCVAEHPRGTDCRLLIDQAHYEGAGDERVGRPTPLGELARQIVLPRSWELPPVPVRGIGHYEQMVRALS